MKYIIIGLGNFGSSLAEKLTEQGNEVIGIDTDMAKVDAYKERITHTICMDATDEYTVTGLPLKDTDVVVVAIGENQGTNVMATALFKSLKVKRLISKATNHIHKRVLQAIGVDEIVLPEEESAERWAKKLCLKGLVNSYELDRNYSIVQVNMPEKYNGKSILEIQIKEKYNLLVLTTISHSEVNTAIGKKRNVSTVKGLANPHDILYEGDILVVYGANKDIQRFLKQ
ncbi:TrkA family potassium uptake protein [Wenyingzhuangia sp. 2_MG-2023]|uniref:potassium channel family protein n=1 Tax=Wenyingzhuangia sp. 2_MG-2023 TaxID=3062639 RepID=UPI0026E23B43|nr:TrkA family potassium uptake protein [Wenyingzhuangia sp. 2_MG-2023]MDO6739217.1 TrkA family potassium uptake protein [Wenyingzhuangia sp. 2_MG-2023]MDO6803782.1 TrkA family potassium uptake protein [Wenyingzhuangia sp. 1_MG-2023]